MQLDDNSEEVLLRKEVKVKVYLDNCCFNRPFDDQSQIRIRLEAEAKLKIQEEIRSGNIQLAWSYILDYENSKNPFQEKKEQIVIWRKYAKLDVRENSEIIGAAQMIAQKGFQKLDSLHLACAISMKCDYFLTTDDSILKKAELLAEVQIDDPIGFIKEVLS
jgi:predicted nucleic acid-binding protein